MRSPLRNPGDGWIHHRPSMARKDGSRPAGSLNCQEPHRNPCRDDGHELQEQHADNTGLLGIASRRRGRLGCRTTIGQGVKPSQNLLNFLPTRPIGRSPPSYVDAFCALLVEPNAYMDRVYSLLLP